MKTVFFPSNLMLQDCKPFLLIVHNSQHNACTSPGASPIHHVTTAAARPGSGTGTSVCSGSDTETNANGAGLTQEHNLRVLVEEYWLGHPQLSRRECNNTELLQIIRHARFFLLRGVPYK